MIRGIRINAECDNRTRLYALMMKRGTGEKRQARSAACMDRCMGGWISFMANSTFHSAHTHSQPSSTYSRREPPMWPPPPPAETPSRRALCFDVNEEVDARCEKMASCCLDDGRSSCGSRHNSSCKMLLRCNFHECDSFVGYAKNCGFFAAYLTS